MANDSITFLCPACNIQLTVPASLAGITGPCPSCRILIQAPYPAPPAAPPGYEQAPSAPQHYETAAAAPYQSPIEHAPTGKAPPYEPPTVPIPVAPAPIYQTPPLVQVGAATASESVAPPAPAMLRPEPRQLPNRSAHGEPVAKQMPEPNAGGSQPNPLPRHSHARSPLFRCLIPLLFILAAGGLMFGVLKVLKNQTRAASRPDPTKPSSVLPILPLETHPGKTPPPPTPKDIEALPVPTPAVPTIVQPPPPLPDGLEPKTPAMAAMEVLEKFLAAKTLAERLPLMETHASITELEHSCLAGRLPSTSRIEIDCQESNPVEQVVDFFHSVDFDATDRPINPQTILVRTRGSGEPKVVVDPFLDSFGGRLAAYAKEYSDKSGIFQVIISAVASCNDERVPNRDKKLTLKLLPQDNAKEITKSYFARQSKITRMLEDGTYSLSYGKAKACTVMLRWNNEDDPAMPYLEALDLKTLDWNP